MTEVRLRETDIKTRFNSNIATAIIDSSTLPYVSKIILFGSEARGEPSPRDTDICVVVRVKRSETYFRDLDVERELLCELKGKGFNVGPRAGQISIKVMAEEDLEVEPDGRYLSTYASEIAKDGIILVDRT